MAPCLLLIWPYLVWCPTTTPKVHRNEIRRQNPSHHTHTSHHPPTHSKSTMTDRATEQTPLNADYSPIEEGHGDRSDSIPYIRSGRSSQRPSPRSSSPPHATFSKEHLQTFSITKTNTPSPIDVVQKLGQRMHPTKNNNVNSTFRNKTVESADVLIRTKQSKKGRKNVGAFRRKRQDYATWKGRVGVHVETDEIDLKKLVNVIYQSLGTEWELVDHYDVIRLWLPLDAVQISGAEENVPAGGGEYADGDGEIHASMPEVFVFGFGAVVFWNFRGEDAERQWMEQHLFRDEVIGLKHNAESIESACDEMGFCYGDSFRWHRDVVQLQTRDAGESY
jgi:uncharacterized Rmd1/YagE family protein